MGKDTEKIRNGYLTSSDMLDKLEERKVRIAQHLSALFFSKSKNLRLHLWVRNMQEKLVEYAKHGSIKSICYKFQSASDKGLLDDKQTLRGI